MNCCKLFYFFVLKVKSENKTCSNKIGLELLLLYTKINRLYISKPHINFMALISVLMLTR